MTASGDYFNCHQRLTLVDFTGSAFQSETRQAAIATITGESVCLMAIRGGLRTGGFTHDPRESGH